MGHVDKETWQSAAAETIRAERSAANLSQAALAEASGIPRPSYIRYETGERVPNIAQLAAIAQGLNMPFSTFMRRVEDRAMNR